MVKKNTVSVQGLRFPESYPVAILILALVAIAVFFDVLFAAQELIPTAYWSDMSRQFIPWRAFGFQQLRQGNLPLWNPHVFCGNPFIGSFQTAMLYPLNLVYLFLPLAKAISLSIAFHVFLAGLFTYLWIRRRGIHPAACLVSAVLLMFCGDHLLHIHAGHLANQASMVWAPLVLLAIDGCFDTRSFRWCLLGMFAVGMQILAGHPQYVFYTGITAVVYSAFQLVKSAERLKVGLGLVAIYGGAVALSAIQLLTGIEASGEAVRAGGLPYHHAAGSSLPPENLLLMLAPGFLGNLTSVPYWGRHYLWEVIPFLSITGLFLAGCGLIYGDRRLRRYSGVMAGILLLMALGGYTPFFKFLYYVVPGFDRFRCSARLIFFVTIFVVMLSAVGLDYLIRNRKFHWPLVLLPAFAALLLGISSLWIASSSRSADPDGMWRRVVQVIRNTDESRELRRAGGDPVFLARAGAQASRSLQIAAGVCLLLAGLFFSLKYAPAMAYLIGLVAVTEILVFAAMWRDHFNLQQVRQPVLNAFFAEHPGDFRIYESHCFSRMNYAVYSGQQDIWGYDPVVLKRYAEFIGHTQGMPREDIAEFFLFARTHPLYRMLRCRYFLQIGRDGANLYPIPDALPHVLLVGDCQVIPGRDAIFSAMDAPSFDPGKTVILESEPSPRPVQSPENGTVRIVDSSTDHLTIEADVTSPSILLVTDAYSKGWKAKALPGSTQNDYTVMPANYVLRAVPLSVGHHVFRMEYLPAGFVFGKWISIISLVGFLGLVGWSFRRSSSGHSKRETGKQVAA